MRLHIWINGKEYTDEENNAGMPLLEYLRSKGCYSVKRGCETSNCGLCTVWIDETAGAFLQCAGAAGHGQTDHYTGRPAASGGRIRRFHGTRRRGSVRFSAIPDYS